MRFSVLTSAGLAAANNITMIAPLGNAGEQYGSVVSVDKAAQVTSYMLQMPYVAPEPVIHKSYDSSVTVFQGPSTFSAHYTVWQKDDWMKGPSARPMAVDVGYHCVLTNSIRSADCTYVEISTYQDAPETKTNVWTTTSEYIQNFNITITAGADKLAPATATATRTPYFTTKARPAETAQVTPAP